MGIKNAVQKAESMQGKVNIRYDISTSLLRELREYYNGRDIGYGAAAFRLGYMQGMKAAKAEMKKGVLG